jgi:hypothetical protein
VVLVQVTAEGLCGLVGHGLGTPVIRPIRIDGQESTSVPTSVRGSCNRMFCDLSVFGARRRLLGPSSPREPICELEGPNPEQGPTRWMGYKAHSQRENDFWDGLSSTLAGVTSAHDGTG